MLAPRGVGPGTPAGCANVIANVSDVIVLQVQCNPCKIGFLLLLVVASIVLVAVVPPVCVLRGCSAKHPASQVSA